MSGSRRVRRQHMNENLEKLIERMIEAGFEVKPTEEKKDE